MTKAPTKTAMKAKIKKNVVKIFSTPLSRSFLVSSASCLPVSTLVPGRAAAEPVAQLSG